MLTTFKFKLCKPVCIPNNTFINVCSNNNEIKTVNDRINALNDKRDSPNIEDVIISTRVSSPVTIIETHPDDMFEELNHYFVTDEISKPITRTTLLTSAKNLLGL